MGNDCNRRLRANLKGRRLRERRRQIKGIVHADWQADGGGKMGWTKKQQIAWLIKRPMNQWTYRHLYGHFLNMFEQYYSSTW